MPVTIDRIETIGTICFAVLGATFLGTGLCAPATDAIPPVPSCASAATGLAIAAILTAAGRLALRRAAEAAFDQGASAAWLPPRAFAFWAGVGCFAGLGNLPGRADLSAGAAVLGTSTLTAAAPSAHVLIGGWRRARR